MIGSIILAATLVSAETTAEPSAPSERLQNALTQVTPTLALTHLPDVIVGQPQFLGQSHKVPVKDGPLAPTWEGVVAPTNLQDFRLRQARGGVFLADRTPVPPFAVSVCDVLLVRPCPQVARVDAGGRIAGVANAQPFRYFSAREKERNPVGAHRPSVDIELAVAPVVNSALPQPALIATAYFHPAPEPTTVSFFHVSPKGKAPVTRHRGSPLPLDFNAAVASATGSIANEKIHENVWTAAAARLAKPVWWVYHAGVFYDLYSTDKVLALCATPQAVAQGWECREGNPLSGGSHAAARYAVSGGTAYGIALMLTAMENKYGERVPWWQELFFTAGIGVLRGFIVGHLNNMAGYNRIKESIR